MADGNAIHVEEFTPEERKVFADIARQDLYFFARWMFLVRRRFPWMRADHHQEICRALMDVYNGKITRLIINIPPRYSKTELAVVNFMAWCLGNVPDAEFIYASYSGKIATKFSYQTRELVKNYYYHEVFPNTIVSNESKAKDDWATTRGGTVYATGMEGTITGFGAGKAHNSFGGALIIDDPIKVQDARRAVALQNAIDYYLDTLESRLNNPTRTPVIVIMQRLNEGDLSGFLLQEAGAAGNGERWTHLCFPAIQVDKDGKEHALWEAKHPLKKLHEMRQAKPYMFAGQMMQKPSTPEGNIFRPDMLNVVDALPSQRVVWVRGWDFASAVPEPGKDPDYSVGFKLGRYRRIDDAEDRYIIAHVDRDRPGPEGTRRMVKQNAKSDTKRCAVDIPIDPGQAGEAQTIEFTKMLPGWRVFRSNERGDKVERAESFATQVNVGNVDMLAGEWNAALKDELRMFPGGLHDDQVDAGARAFNRLLEVKGGLAISDDVLAKI
jgi:predicted phage terminase large subunit-like protein